MALAKVQEIVSSNPVVIFCERYAPDTVCVKQLFFLKLGAPYNAVDLDDESDAVEIHVALARWTGRMGLPSVFIGGKFIGGCRETWNLYKEGKLVPLLAEAQVACPLSPVLTRSPENELSQPNVEKKEIGLN